jgi:hypothetical protein
MNDRDTAHDAVHPYVLHNLDRSPVSNGDGVASRSIERTLVWASAARLSGRWELDLVRSVGTND